MNLTKEQYTYATNIIGEDYTDERNQIIDAGGTKPGQPFFGIELSSKELFDALIACEEKAQQQEMEQEYWYTIWDEMKAEDIRYFEEQWWIVKDTYKIKWLQKHGFKEDIFIGKANDFIQNFSTLKPMKQRIFCSRKVIKFFICNSPYRENRIYNRIISHYKSNTLSLYSVAQDFLKHREYIYSDQPEMIEKLFESIIKLFPSTTYTYGKYVTQLPQY